MEIAVYKCFFGLDIQGSGSRLRVTRLLSMYILSQTFELSKSRHHKLLFHLGTVVYIEGYSLSQAPTALRPSVLLIGKEATLKQSLYSENALMCSIHNIMHGVMHYSLTQIYILLL